MKKIYSYVFKLFVSPLLATFFVSLFVLLMQFLWRYVEDIVGQGLEWRTLAEFFTYSTLTLVPTALPLAILLASLMTFGNLGERLELLSIKTAGVSLFKVMRPLMIFVAFISLAAFFFANNVLPHSMSELRALMHEIKHQRPELTLKEKVFDHSMENMTVKVGSKASDGSMLYDVMIYDHRNSDDQGSVTVADSGTIVFAADRSYSTITLYDGESYAIVKEEGKRYNNRTVPYRRDKFEKQTIIIETTENYKRPNAEIYGNHRMGQNLSQLNESVLRSDSVFSKKQNEVTGRLKRTTYLDSRLYEKRDSAYVAEVADIDSLFLHTDYATQLTILSKAKDQAAKIKNNLASRYKDLKYRRFTMKQYMAERHRRFTLPFACFVFFFIGAPLGAIIRKGGFGMPIVVSILFFVVYYIIDTFGYKFATESFTSVWFGMWMSSALLLVIGGFLTWKAATDSEIMDSEAYRHFFKKLYFFKKNTHVR